MQTRTTSFLVGLVFVGTVAALAIADEPDGSMPDPNLTPGLVASADVNEVCASDGLPGSSYSRKHRQTTQAMKREVLQRYGIHGKFRGEIDHRTPLCLGGADAIVNLWPQRDFREKDKLEAYACREVCAGRIQLQDAQLWFLGDWRKELWRVR